MGTFKFSMKMLIRDYKKSLFYGLTLVFAVAICFVFFNIINNEHLADQTIMTSGATWQNVQVPFSTTLSFMVICFCCFMIFFANNFFLTRKTTELAVMGMSGSGYINSTMYVLYQTFVLLGLATPLGLLIGRLFVPYSNAYMFEKMGVVSDVNFIPQEAYIYSFLLVAIVLAMICVLTAGYLHRNDILVLLSQEKEMNFHGSSNKNQPLYYIIIYIFGIVMMFMNPHSPTAYIAPTLVGMVGVTGIIRYVLPDIIKKLKKDSFLTKRYLLISISNLGYSIQRSLLLFTLMTVSVTGMMAILASNLNSPREFVTSVMGYIVVIILLVVSIVYKLIMEAGTRKILFFNLWKIGYTKDELKKIVKQEVIMYYAILIFIPSIYILFIAGRFIYYGDMTLNFVLLFNLAYIIPIVLSGFITYFEYRNAVVKPIKGGR
ncbi:MAG: ABC transporter permease [Faecalibacillus sp.]